MAAFYVLLTGHTFDVRAIDITGAKFVEPSVFTDAAAATSENIFRLNTRSISDRIERLGVTTSVGITSALPNSVRVKVVVAPPVVVLLYKGNSYSVSQDGTVLGPGALSGLPQLIDEDETSNKAPRELDPALVRAVQYIFDNINRATGFSVTAVSYSEVRGLTLKSPTGTAIDLGDTTNLDEKLSSIGPLLKVAATDSGHSTIDLSDPQHPFIR